MRSRLVIVCSDCGFDPLFLQVSCDCRGSSDRLCISCSMYHSPGASGNGHGCSDVVAGLGKLSHIQNLTKGAFGPRKHDNGISLACLMQLRLSTKGDSTSARDMLAVVRRKRGAADGTKRWSRPPREGVLVGRAGHFDRTSPPSRP